MTGEGGGRPAEDQLGGPTCQLSPDQVADQLDNVSLQRGPERVSNSSLFQRFLEQLSLQCSSGLRFNCEASGECCAPCSVVRRHIATYVDVAMLEEIAMSRRQADLCGYLYCNRSVANRGRHARNESTYKIDLAARQVYPRKVYESFCSAACIEKNASVEAAAAKSPMETGVITPRAVRNSSPKSLHALLSGLRRLQPCAGVAAPSTQPHTTWVPLLYRTREPEQVKDKCVMFNYKPLAEAKRVHFDLPDPPAEQSATPQLAGVGSWLGENDRPRKGSVARGQAAGAADTDSRRAGLTSPAEESAFDYSGLYDPSEAVSPRAPLLKCLNLFSILWYTLSTCLTYRTREYLRSGALTGCSLDDKTRLWYATLLRHLPEDMVPTVSKEFESMLSTFRIGNNTPVLSEDLYRVLAYVLLYALLRNRGQVLAAGPGSAPIDSYLRDVEAYLVETCNLDVDSIQILNEMLTECE
ncbi:hypothetical protein, conserved [Babesia bigemina]|uniref:RTR1-type domain-containing protein n=1 Tax=Babesia bigemina TaxID=5866 RepID=A0A061D743_BABBI|nr:hypothetical protein, conserved [Babesia bigemina]CDR94739.1 hypothetical protein, conserved [Babesia bigemina]|eukprot:XP_012766925.1 hypothetical protein, conserved [Babesia bigemina]